MRRFTILAAAGSGLWWSLLLPTWVVTAGVEISGSELNRTVVLVPGIVILLLLISLYGKLSRVLVGLAALFALLATAWAFARDFASSSAVIEAQELATGIAGGTADLELNLMPILFGIAGLLVASLSVFAALGKRVAHRTVDEKATDSDDPRFIWDEQSK